MISRDIGDITTNPGGKSGTDWTKDARSSVLALWALSAGRLTNVAGVNSITADITIEDGFTAYSDGLYASFVPVASNTGPATINVGGIGVKPLRDPNGDPLTVGSLVDGRLAEIVFVEPDDHFRLVTSGGTTNVTVVGGIILQRSAPSRLVTAAGPATGVTSIASLPFQCDYADSRVIIEGTVGRVTGAGSADEDGVVIALFVDGVSVDSFTDHCQPNAQVNTPFTFTYSPGNTDSHTYSVRVSSTISATYPKGVNCAVCSEISPNG